MKHGQATNKPYTHKAIDDKDNGSGRFGHSTPNSNIFRVLDLHNIDPAKGEHKNADQSCREDKHVEEAVIPQSNALADPGAMMVKALNTIITNRAMGTPRRSVQHARVTILDFNSYTIYVYVLGARQPELLWGTV
jgi:hypothetical protein